MCTILSSVGILSTNVDNDFWNHGSYTRVLAAWFSKTPVWIGSGSDVVRSAEVFQLSVFARLQHQLRYIQQCFDWTKFWMFWASGMPWGFVVRWVLFLIIFRGTCTWHPLTPTCSLIQLSNLAARVQKKQDHVWQESNRPTTFEQCSKPLLVDDLMKQEYESIEMSNITAKKWRTHIRIC